MSLNQSTLPPEVIGMLGDWVKQNMHLLTGTGMNSISMRDILTRPDIQEIIKKFPAMTPEDQRAKDFMLAQSIDKLIINSIKQAIEEAYKKIRDLEKLREAILQLNEITSEENFKKVQDLAFQLFSIKLEKNSTIENSFQGLIKGFQNDVVNTINDLTQQINYLDQKINNIKQAREQILNESSQRAADALSKKYNLKPEDKEKLQSDIKNLSQAKSELKEIELIEKENQKKSDENQIKMLALQRKEAECLKANGLPKPAAAYEAHNPRDIEGAKRTKQEIIDLVQESNDIDKAIEAAGKQLQELERSEKTKPPEPKENKSGSLLDKISSKLSTTLSSVNQLNFEIGHAENKAEKLKREIAELKKKRDKAKKSLESKRKKLEKLSKLKEKGRIAPFAYNMELKKYSKLEEKWNQELKDIRAQMSEVREEKKYISDLASKLNEEKEHKMNKVRTYENAIVETCSPDDAKAHRSAILADVGQYTQSAVESVVQLNIEQRHYENERNILDEKRKGYCLAASDANDKLMIDARKHGLNYDSSRLDAAIQPYLQKSQPSEERERRVSISYR